MHAKNPGRVCHHYLTKLYNNKSKGKIFKKNSLLSKKIRTNHVYFTRRIIVISLRVFLSHLSSSLESYYLCCQLLTFHKYYPIKRRVIRISSAHHVLFRIHMCMVQVIYLIFSALYSITVR